MSNWMFQRVFWGLFLIGIGVFFLLNRMGVLDMDIGELFSAYWPVLLILFGLKGFIEHRGSRGSTWNLFIVLLGGMFLGNNLGYIDWTFEEFVGYAIPVLVIGIGLNMVFRPKPHWGEHREQWKEQKKQWKEEKKRYKQGAGHENWIPNPPPPPPPPPSSVFDPDRVGKEDTQGESSDEQGLYEKVHVPPPPPPPPHGAYSHHFGQDSHHHEPKVMNRSNFIGDIHLGQDVWELVPMNISHFIGDTVLDLTKAQIPYGETKINISAFIGDVTVFVPNDLELEVYAASSVFLGDISVMGRNEGGFMKHMELKDLAYMDAPKKIRLHASMFIGDLKVSRIG